MAVLNNLRQHLILEECQRLCDATPQCNAIAWNSEDNRCFLKNKKDACGDVPCAWGVIDAIDWNLFWKTCGNCHC